MNRRILLSAAASATALVLAGCGGASDDAGTTTLQVAAATPPMTDIVQAASEAIGDGYEIEMVEVADYVQPNAMLEAGEIDANFIQHIPFMEQFNEANDASLVGVQPVYLTAVAFYSKDLESIDELPDGGSVVLPADAANLGRALQMLADADIITIADGVEPFMATMDDIADNPRDLKFTEVELLQANAAYEEADAVFNLPAFANQVGLSPFEDGLTFEEDDRFAVTLVTREDSQDTPETQALIDAFTSQEVLDVLEEFESTPAF